MSGDIWAMLMAVLLWFVLIAYAVFGGADFGAGVWDLLASGPRKEDERGAFIQAIGPVWEANNIWLILLITGTLTAFPIVFSTLSTALIIPLFLALLGVVLRGAGFAYFSHFRRSVAVNLIWGTVFSAASLIAPFFFGAAAAAIAGGHIHVRAGGQVQANYWTTWLTPFGISCGAFAVALCACLAATYLTVEMERKGETELLAIYRRDALLSGGVVSVIGIIALITAHFDAPYLFSNLFGKSLLILLAAMAAGLATAGMLYLRRYFLARALLIGTVALILAAWAYAQAPDLIVPDVTIGRAAAPDAVEKLVFFASLVGLAVVVPSLILLLRVFKGTTPPPSITAEDMAFNAPPPTPPAVPIRPPLPPEVARQRVESTLRVAGVAVVSLLALLAMRVWGAIRSVRAARREQRANRRA